MKKLEKMGAKIVSQLTINSRFGWPPDCNGIIYHPVRPVDKANTANVSELAFTDVKHVCKK